MDSSISRLISKILLEAAWTMAWRALAGPFKRKRLVVPARRRTDVRRVGLCIGIAITVLFLFACGDDGGGDGGGDNVGTDGSNESTGSPPPAQDLRWNEGNWNQSNWQ